MKVTWECQIYEIRAQIEEEIAMAKTARKGAKKRRSTPIDGYVGSRVQQRRLLLGMSQEMLGKALGITFQQIQKYEHGSNRIGASRLFTLSKVLNVPVSFFFEDMPKALVDAGSKAKGFPRNSALYETDPMATPETAKLVRAYYGIEDETKRRMVLQLIRSMSN